MNLPGGILEPLGPPQQSVWPMLNIRLADQYPADSLLIPMQRDPQSGSQLSRTSMGGI
jgi:hypothetical protein